MKIVMIDDSVTIKKWVSRVLDSMGGHQLFQATNGDDGLEVLSQNYPVDLVLLDINMPGKNGLEILKLIRENQAYSEIPVIMMTSEAEKSTILNAIRLGATDYLVKPFGEDEFISRLSAYIH